MQLLHIGGELQWAHGAIRRPQAEGDGVNGRASRARLLTACCGDASSGPSDIHELLWPKTERLKRAAKGGLAIVSDGSNGTCAVGGHNTRKRSGQLFLCDACASCFQKKCDERTLRLCCKPCCDRRPLRLNVRLAADGNSGTKGDVVLEAGHAGERTQHGEQRGDFRRHRSGVSGVRRS